MKVLTIGTFDLFHAGHVRLLARCAELGELYVGVNSDDFVHEYKDKRPVFCWTDRCRTIDALPFVKRVFGNDDRGHALIRRVRPDILAIGSDWHPLDYLGQIGMTQRDVDELDMAILYLPYTDGVSTTALRERLGC